MDYKREDAAAFSVEERIKNFNEFHTPLSKEEQQKQGARCMDCGVPFCQAGMKIGNAFSGCPLNNLIPEWNDLIYKGNWEQAYYRLHMTNNFPEFTSRVCPALCEKACTCGANGDAVTTKANEYYRKCLCLRICFSKSAKGKNRKDYCCYRLRPVRSCCR